MRDNSIYPVIEEPTDRGRPPTALERVGTAFRAYESNFGGLSSMFHRRGTAMQSSGFRRHPSTLSPAEMSKPTIASAIVSVQRTTNPNDVVPFGRYV